MKEKILKVVGVIVLIIVVTGICLGIKQIYVKKAEKNLTNKKWVNNHVNIVTSDINNDVYVVNKDEKITTYNMTYQEVIDEQIKEFKQNKDLVMIYNPYSTNTNSVNIYFDTDEKVKVSYTIKVNDYSDFSKTVDSDYTASHSYQLIGFVMGEVNNLTITLEDEEGNTKEYNYTLDFTKYSIDTPNKLTVTTEDEEELTDGLYAILGDSREDQDYIHLVDNDGVVRTEIPIIGYRGLRLLFKDDNMYFSISEKRLASLNKLGKVTNKYYLGKYKLHHDYAFDENKENLLILASDTTKSSCEDAVIKLNLETGAVTDSFYLEEVFGDVLDKAYYNEDEIPEQVESVGVDWMHINTINYLENDTVILSSRETSSVLKIKDIFNNPTIEYILGDEKLWSNFDEKEYLYEKVGDFIISGGQHTVTYQPTDEDGVYYLTMFNNNLGVSLTMPKFDFKSIGLEYSTPKDKGKSYFYKYKVDENKKTFELVQSFEVPWSAYMSSSQEYNNHIIIDSGQQCTFSERKEDGTVIKSYKFKCESNVYRVFKYDFKNYYFE